VRARSQVVIAAIAVTAALAGCAIEQVTYKPEEPVEDCEVVGDEDGNGVADCGDPACAAMPACRPVCGNGIPESGEACDDGDLEDGDGCDRNCTVTDCGSR
jgi:cysteine-rich repeat protein